MTFEELEMLKKFEKPSTSYKVSNLENIEITLTIKEKGNTIPDYHFMETLIRAVEKLVIKDVVDWLDKKIEITKGVLGDYWYG